MVAPLQAVIFDYGGVLRGDGREEWDTVDAAAGLPPGTLWAAWHDIPEYRLSRAGAIDGVEFRAAIHRALMPTAGDAARAEAVLAALEAHLAGLPPIDPDMRALLARLRAVRGLELGLLSNANRGYSERLRARGVTDFFDDVVVSGDVGLAKPDPAVFRLAAERLGVAPATCLMIDDQAQHLRGAATTGMRTHRFGPPRGLAALVARLDAEGVLPTQHP
jgi:putative hydrolase of the HAD superfamily